MVCGEICFRQFTSLTYHTKLVAAAKLQNHVKISYFHSSQTHKADNEFDRFQVVICIRKRLVGLKPTRRNSRWTDFSKTEPVSGILGSSERVQYSNNQFIIAFLKRLAGSSFKWSLHLDWQQVMCITVIINLVFISFTTVQIYELSYIHLYSSIITSWLISS